MSKTDFASKDLKDRVAVLENLIKKKSYTFNASRDATENCFPLDLLTASTAVLGIKVKDRAGWNFIARNGVSGNSYSVYWALTLANGTLTGTYNIDVYYTNL